MCQEVPDAFFRYPRSQTIRLHRLSILMGSCRAGLRPGAATLTPP